MARAQTADDGSFELTDTTEGTWNVSMNRSNDENGAWSMEGESQAVKAPAEGVRLVATQRKTTIVAGRIVLADGSIVPLCTLKLGSGAQNFGYNPGGQGSNEVVGGEFRREFTATPPFEIAVSGVRGSTGTSLNVRPKTVKITEAVTDLVITLEAGGEIAGRVMDASNGGVEGVTLSSGSSSTVSDATGAFRLSGLGTGEVSVTAKAPAKYVSPPAFKATVGASDVVVRVTTGLAISGKVVGMEQVPGVNVNVQGQAGNVSPYVQVGADGSFRLEGFAEDAVATIHVQAWSQSKDRSFRPLVVKGVRAGTEGLVLRLELGVSVSGTIVDADGKPATGIYVSVQDPEGRGYGGRDGRGRGVHDQGADARSRRAQRAVAERRAIAGRRHQGGGAREGRAHRAPADAEAHGAPPRQRHEGLLRRGPARGPRPGEGRQPRRAGRRRPPTARSRSTSRAKGPTA